MIGKHEDMISKIVTDVVSQWEAEEKTTPHVITIRLYLEFFNVPMLKRIESFLEENRHIRIKNFIETMIEFDKILMNRKFF